MSTVNFKHGHFESTDTNPFLKTPSRVFLLLECETVSLKNLSFVLSDCSRKLTKKCICFLFAEWENSIWCPRCHLRNRWRVRLSGRQALWSRRKSLVTNLQCLPDRRVAYNKKTSSSELNKTNGKDRCHAQGSKWSQEMNQMLIRDLFISNTNNSHHYSSPLGKWRTTAYDRATKIHCMPHRALFPLTTIW